MGRQRLGRVGPGGVGLSRIREVWVELGWSWVGFSGVR